MSFRVIVTGAGGQLGWELQRTAPAGVELHALSSADLDITNAQAVMARVRDIRPDWIINAAAYTAVDKAESEPERAHAVNEHGARHLAQAALAVGARMVQVSTDFIFDGEQGHPYRPVPPVGANSFAHAPGIDADVRMNSHLQPDHANTLKAIPLTPGEGGLRGGRPGERGNTPNPLSIYGASKLAGEVAVRDTLADRALIIRTAWVYSSHGHNFVKSMLRLMRERESLGIVADQVGSPTWAHGLARAIWRSMDLGLHGVHHWTDAGVASWYDFACAIHDEARALGLLERDTPIRPIRTEDYPTPARRPAYSVLDKTATWQALDITAPTHWRAQLRAMLMEMRSPCV